MRKIFSFMALATLAIGLSVEARTVVHHTVLEETMTMKQQVDKPVEMNTDIKKDWVKRLSGLPEAIAKPKNLLPGDTLQINNYNPTHGIDILMTRIGKSGFLYNKREERDFMFEYGFSPETHELVYAEFASIQDNVYIRASLKNVYRNENGELAPLLTFYGYDQEKDIHLPMNTVTQLIDESLSFLEEKQP
jgi:hypothetical protein